MQLLDSIVGQTQAKNTLKVLIQSTKNRNGPLPHILLSGPPGVGKSSIARSVAKELGYKFAEVNAACTGSTSETRIKLFCALEELKPNQIIFMDEIHAITKSIQEMLYTALEEGYINFGGIFEIQTKLKPFTLIGATTNLAGLTTAMQSRFHYKVILDSYSLDEIAQIISNTAKINNWKIDANQLAVYCRNNPRTAKQYLDWIHRYCNVHNKQPNQQTIEEAMQQQGVYRHGLNSDDLKYIRLLKKNKIMGVRTIANTLNIPEHTVKTKIEPYLLSLNLINILTNMQNKRGINLKKCSELNL